LPELNTSGDAWKSYLFTQRPLLDKVGGGMMHVGAGMKQVLGWVLATPEYRLRDKLNFFRGTLFSVDSLWDDVMTTNLIETAGAIDIPVYFLQGEWDYQTPTPLARELFAAIEAPAKEYVVFENSAHSPIFEEPENFNAFVREKAAAIMQ